MNYYFFQTVKIEGRPRLRALEGQDIDGEPVDTSLNVQADSIMRGSYPTGTIFGSHSLEKRTHSSTPFYSAGAIFPLDIALGNYINDTHIPSQEMVSAWNAFKGSEKKPKKQAPAIMPDLFSIPETEQTRSTLLEQMKADKTVEVPSIKQDGFYICDKDWYLLVRNIRSGINTLLIGASGTGKTEMVMLACRKLGVRCSVYDMGSMHDPVAGLLGVHRLQNGGSVFDYAKFTQDIQQPGVILLDELSRAPVTANNILFPCLDSRRCLPVEIAAGKDIRSIKVHPQCTFIATANVGAEYTGTMSLDRALVGRFFPLELDYMPVGEEAIVLTKRCSIPKVDAANIVAVAATIRSLFSKQELSCSVSTRETLMAAQLVADGWTALEAMEMTFLPLFEGTRKDGERAVVSKIFLTR